MPKLLAHTTGPGIRRFDLWLKQMGRTAMTGYRWRQRGWLRVINIAGKTYITDEEIQCFIQRGQSGEFFLRTLEAKTTAEIKRGIKASHRKARKPASDA